jgi:hypothetical protein
MNDELSVSEAAAEAVADAMIRNGHAVEHVAAAMAMQGIAMLRVLDGATATADTLRSLAAHLEGAR